MSAAEQNLNCVHLRCVPLQVGSNTPNFNRMAGNPLAKQIPWDTNPTLLAAWKEGNTGELSIKHTQMLVGARTMCESHMAPACQCRVFAHCMPSQWRVVMCSAATLASLHPARALPLLLLCLTPSGYPWIDAAMRQLREWGWMHHLARHSVACFLTRGDLYISWEEGQAVFEEYLIDAVSGAAAAMHTATCCI